MHDLEPRVIVPEPNLTPSRLSRRQRLKSVAATLLILIAAPLTAFVLTVYVFQSYEVDGPSMETTLSDNDRLVVLKLGRSWARLTGKTYLPSRGDIIVFNKSESGSALERKRQLIKRVIGVAGDRLVISGGEVIIYNDQHPTGFRPDKTLAHGLIKGPTTGTFDLTIVEDEVFVLGDNRMNSLDSRTFGAVSNQEIVGRLWLRIFPLKNFDNF